MRYVIETDKGIVLEVTNMFDINGDKADAAWQVEAIVAKLPDGKFLQVCVYPEQVHAIQ